MLSPDVVDALNAQMNVERTNEAVYMQLASILDNLNWAGSAKTFYAWADEERGHFAKIRDWLITNNVTPQLSEIPAVTNLGTEPDDVVPYYEAALKLEEDNLARFDSLYKQIFPVNPTTASFLEWFMVEQVESVNELQDTLQLLKRMTKGEQALWDVGLID